MGPYIMAWYMHALWGHFINILYGHSTGHSLREFIKGPLWMSTYGPSILWHDIGSLWGHPINILYGHTTWALHGGNFMRALYEGTLRGHSVNIQYGHNTWAFFLWGDFMKVLHECRCRSFLEAVFKSLDPSFVWFEQLSRTKRGVFISRTHPRS